MTTYWEKLRDPRWQRKRLEIMNRAGFKCEECGNDKETLNVHHLIYHKSFDPWDYSSSELKCLCERCHEVWHKLKDISSFLLRDLPTESIREFLGAGYAIAMRDGYIVDCQMGSEAARSGFAKILALVENKKKGKR
jgi:hypothetical protein